MRVISIGHRWGHVNRSQMRVVEIDHRMKVTGNWSLNRVIEVRSLKMGHQKREPWIVLFCFCFLFFLPARVLEWWTISYEHTPPPYRKPERAFGCCGHGPATQQALSRDCLIGCTLWEAGWGLLTRRHLTPVIMCSVVFIAHGAFTAIYRQTQPGIALRNQAVLLLAPRG